MVKLLLCQKLLPTRIVVVYIVVTLYGNEYKPICVKYLCTISLSYISCCHLDFAYYQNKITMSRDVHKFQQNLRLW